MEEILTLGRLREILFTNPVRILDKSLDILIEYDGEYYTVDDIDEDKNLGAIVLKAKTSEDSSSN